MTKKTTTDQKSNQEPAEQAPTIINRYAQKEGLRLLLLEAENFKSIKHVVINLEGRSMLITGKNEKGKSSVIQIVTGILNSKLLPSEAVKKGEESAKISISIGGNTQGGYKQYTATMHFTAKNQSGRLVVTNENGETVKGPATILANLIKDNSFDITSWMTQKKPERLRMLKQLTGCGQQIDLITNEITNLKAIRKSKKERAESLEGALDNHEFSQEDRQKYQNPIDISGLQGEYNEISQNIQLWHSGNNELNNLYSGVQQTQNRIKSAQDEILRLREAITTQEAMMNREAESIQSTQQRILNGEAWKRENPIPTLDSVNTRMSEAIAHNDKYNRMGMLGNQHAEMISIKQEVEGFKSKIESLEADRVDIISKSQLPVKGLTFSDDEIYLTNDNGETLPLDESQINTTGLFDIGAEIAMAMHPDLKIIFLHDASLYDRDHLKVIIDKCENRGYQIIAEVVTNSDELEFLFTEDVLK